MNKFVLTAEDTGECLYAKDAFVDGAGLYRLPKDRWPDKEIDMETIESDERFKKLDALEWEPVVTEETYKKTRKIPLSGNEIVDALNIKDMAKAAADAAWNDVVYSPDNVVLRYSRENGEAPMPYTDEAYDYFVDCMPDCAERYERIGRCFEYGTVSESKDFDMAEEFYEKAAEKGSALGKKDLERVKKSYINIPKEALVRYEEPTEGKKGKAFVAYPTPYPERRISGVKYKFAEIPVSEPIDLFREPLSIPVRDSESYNSYESGSLLNVAERKSWWHSPFDVKALKAMRISEDDYTEAATDIKKQSGKKIRATIDASCLTLERDGGEERYKVSMKVDRKEGRYVCRTDQTFYINPEDVKLSPDFKKATLSLPYGAQIYAYNGVTSNAIARQYPYKSFDEGNGKGGKR